MSLEHNDVQSLETAIIAEAKQDAAEIMADAWSRAENIHQQAQEQVDAQRETILRQGREKAEVLHSQTVISAQMEAQTLKLRRREELLARVFVEARRRLAPVPQSPDYAQVVRRLIREAGENLGDGESLVILADGATRAMIDETMTAALEQELGMHLEVGEPLKRGTGVVLQTSDGRRRYDNTLEARLARMQSVLRASVYRILMGETR